MKYEHIGQLINDSVTRFADLPALRFKKDGEWKTLSYAQFGEKIQRLSAALIKAGINQGDAVGIYSANRYEWAVSDFACTQIGAVSVPIYATNTMEQARFIIEDANIKLVFSGNRDQYNNLAAVHASGIPLQVISFDDYPDANSDFTQCFQHFLDIMDADDYEDERNRRSDAIRSGDLTTIIYTSGTTGNPKGVMLTHANLFHQMECVDANFDVSSDDTSLCFLPLSHVYERMWSYYVYFKGAYHAYLEDPKQVIETLQELKPTAMVSVPRLYEKIYSAVMNSQENASAIKKALFKAAIATGDKYNNLFFRDQPVPTGLKVKYKILDALVLKKVRAVVGGEKNFFSAGGAPLEKSIEEFFLSCGLLICQGYGLTETSPMVSYNTPQNFKFGTVGKPVPNCDVRIGEGGEVQVKGPQVMLGYFNNPSATDKVMENGWFKTGDVGEFDEDGYLRITDRIKDLIITSGGKNIAPLNIETRVGKDFYIEQIIAIGDKRNFISALIVPAFESLEEWAHKKKIKFQDQEELITHPHVVDFFRKRIDEQSKKLAQYETIKKFKLLAKPFTMEGGEITPTLKLKRKQINEKFQALIDSMYNKKDQE
ncbi:MAG: long-chain fatty acid--CoA ligase [Candidatus Marinimicrobia bacterium]|nr:long-chain fatty acid--CoA ligase [Candidatus Neomarinimicrobiota bacterium]MCF7850318.1 long-chain fatty acid--CoA ligase [Candidatus Neomarinimicrobiota bacterium]MCF7903910.1 long-chain fatty acid--CoA ligase [Candidatus Neomarinimicrobiota bacterium]